MTREEALEAIKAKMDYYESDKRLRGALETLIPELAESEGEKILGRIRLCLDECVHSDIIRDYERDECLAYLEKQKEPSTDYFSTNHIETLPDGTTVRHTIGYLEKKDSSSDDYCKENCKGYQETGKCFFDEPCLGKKEWDKNLLDTDEEREKLKHEAWSEEERVKKIITDSVFYQYGAGAEYKDVLDYLDKLEKQKEQDKCPEYCVRSHCIGCSIYEKQKEKPSIFPLGFGEVRWNPISSVQQKSTWSEEDEKKRNGLIKGLEDRMGFGWASDPYSREEYIAWLKALPHENL